jgi:formamidopyrimidine-DNA glycosylase
MEPVFHSPVVGIPATVIACTAHSIVESYQAGGQNFYHIKMNRIPVPDRKALNEALTNLGLPGIKSRAGYLCLHCLQCNVADPLSHIGGRGLNCSLVYLQDGTTSSEMQCAAKAALVSAKSRTMRDLVTNSTAHLTQSLNDGLGNLEDMLKVQAQSRAQVQAQPLVRAPVECQLCYGDFIDHVTCQKGIHAYCYECYEGG